MSPSLRRICRGWFATLLLCLSGALQAQSFVIDDIDVEGIERISKGTVLNYLPIRSGESLAPEDVGRLIRALYDTGLFTDVAIGRRDNTLVVRLTERPAIAELNIEGNSLIGEEDLNASLRDLGIAKGRVFNRSVLEQVEQELRRLYFSQGNYGMSIKTEVETLERNRVAIDIDINEGETTRIRQISLVGNQVYDDERLLDLLESGVPSPLNVFSSADDYSRAKLSGDLERLRSWYQDHGYLRFSIDSTQVSISPDKQDIYITINLTEGEQYTVRSVQVLGQTEVPAEEIDALVDIQAGDVFSRKRMTEIRSAIIDRLGADGYAFAKVNVVPEIDDEQREADLKYFIDPGKRVYVRRITFSGAGNTQERVFRRELRQFEGGWFSPQKLARSRVRIQRLSYVETVTADTVRVTGTDDQVDINFTIAERASSSFSIGAGFSSSDGVLFNMNLSHDNLFGSGNRLVLAFDNSATNTQYSVSYTNPYYTDDGISRSFNFFIRETDAAALVDTSEYLADTYGLNVNYGIPLSEFSTMRLGVGYERTVLTPTELSPDHIVDFIDVQGEDSDVYKFNASYIYDTRNRTVFSERGLRHRLDGDVSIPQSDLKYYKLGYSFEYFKTVNDPLVLAFSSSINHGDGYDDQTELPFFTKYFAGGVRSVRGYAGSSLGPRDSNNNAKGGDFRFIGTLEMIFPPPYTDEPSSNTRFSLFYDFGTVYEDYDAFDAGELRTSAGVAFIWLSPIGPLTFSIAEALNAESGDDTQAFQFTIGTLF